jgi:bacterial leucyl aminopeptidase
MSMANHVLKTTLVLISLLALTVMSALGRGDFAARTQHWVSVDARELAVVTSAVKSAGGTPLDAAVARVINGIAVLQLDDAQLEELSRGMHENFQKCSGFIEHRSETDAVAWIERLNTVNTLVPDVIYTIDNQAAVNALMAATTETSTRQTILDLSAFPNRRYNQPSGMDSANWIKNKWSQLAATRGSNNTVEFFTHTANISPQPSVILTIRGSVFPNEVVVVGAHQDSINLNGQTLNAPGADDDGSGIACLTEMIRVLTSKHFRPARTVKFMAYAAEEVGLRGSDNIAATFRAANTNVVGVLQLDMTNYRGTQGWDIVMITDFTNAAQNQFIHNLITAYQPNLIVADGTCGYACSDHASWDDRGYAASFPFEAQIGDDNPFIHTANDTISQSNNNAVGSMPFTKLGLSYVAELAKGCISPRILCGSDEPTRTAKTTLKLTSTGRGNSGSVLLDAMSY